MFCRKCIHLQISRFLLSAMCVVFGSCSEIGLLHFSWLVKFVTKFGKYGRNCVSDRGKCGHLCRDIRVHSETLLPLVMYPVAVGSEKRYPQCEIC